MTVQQARDLREAVLKARSADAIFIAFDNVGHSLISAGKIKEGLAAYREVAAQRPKEALHKVRLAQALITAGLGEQSRRVAVESTALEPSSALAQRTMTARSPPTEKPSRSIRRIKRRGQTSLFCLSSTQTERGTARKRG
jgi:hypothetical protein